MVACGAIIILSNQTAQAVLKGQGEILVEKDRGNPSKSGT
jgi:hypothetical protein